MHSSAFLLKGGCIMFPITPINYDRTIELLRDRNYKIAIFLLYDQNQITVHYPMALGEQFWRLNTRATGDYVALLTFYDESLVNYDKDPFKNGRGYCNFKRDEIITGMQDEPGPISGVKGICALSDSDKSSPYTTMKKIASAFDTDVVNQFPCFVILNPNNPKHYTVQKVKGISSIVREISDIVNDLEDNDFDLDKYAEYCKQPHYYLSSKELFEINLKSTRFGINVHLLKEAIKSDHLEDFFDFETIDRLSKDGYIPAKLFLKNLHNIKYKDIDCGETDTVCELIDRYITLSFFKDVYSKDAIFFSDIKDYIEDTSVEYLKLAKEFYDGSLKHIKASNSLVAICLGKVVEDELNLGVFNIFRGVFNIKLPQYFNRVQKNLKSLKVDFVDSQNGYNNINGFSLRFNEWRFPHGSKLKYQKPVYIRKLAFDSKYNISPSDRQYSKKEAVAATRGKIKNLSKTLLNKTIDFNKLTTNLEIIAESRNLAIHNAEPIQKDILENSIKAFEYLVETHFFEMNRQLKECKCN